MYELPVVDVWIYVRVPSKNPFIALSSVVGLNSKAKPAPPLMSNVYSKSVGKDNPETSSVSTPLEDELVFVCSVKLA